MPPTEALLTPRSDTTSTESSASPPDRDRAPSDTSSGIHSSEECRDEVVIRPRPGKSIIKPPPPAIEEEPYGRTTNLRMSTFNKDSSSATLPLTRASADSRNEYQCSTMPLPMGYHQQQQQYLSQSFVQPNNQPGFRHTTLPNGVRYTSNQYLKRMPYMKNTESPYGHTGLGSGHHTFSKLMHDPLALPPPLSPHNTFTPTTIPEDRDSANYSMISEHDREIFISNTQVNHIQMHN